MRTPILSSKASLIATCTACICLSTSGWAAISYEGDTLPQLSTQTWVKKIPNNNDYNTFQGDPAFSSRPDYLDPNGVDDYILTDESASNGILHYAIENDTSQYGGDTCLQCHSPSAPLTGLPLMREGIDYWPLSYTRQDDTLNNSAGTTVVARLRFIGGNPAGIEISDGSFNETLDVRMGHARLISAFYFSQDADNKAKARVDLQEKLGSGFDSREFHTYRLSLQGSTATVSVDCTEVMSAQVPVSSNAKHIRFGSITHHSGMAAEVEWDYVKYGQGAADLGECASNTPPVADAGDDVTLGSDQLVGAVLQGSGTDADTADLLQCQWRAGDSILQGWMPVAAEGQCPLELSAYNLGIGAHTLSLEISDGTDTVSDSMVLTVDNAAPTASPSGAGVYELFGNVTLGGVGSDYDGDLLTYQWSEGVDALCAGTVTAVAGGAPVALPDCVLSNLDVGEHTLRLTVSDGINQPVASELLAKIVDTAVPTIQPVVNQGILSPPNHKMVAILITANARDNSGQPVSLNAIVSSNEPENGLGDGDMSPDWIAPVIDQDTGTISLQLRAERAGNGDGRTYTITLFAADSSGNTSTTDVQVKVAHDSRAK